MFTRSSRNPILVPKINNSWESRKVYNPGAVYYNNKWHLFYRAVGRDGCSSIGYAVSNDGERFKRTERPVLTVEHGFEKKGLGDPRIVKVNSTFFLTYTAYDGMSARLAFATARNLTGWTKQGLMIKSWDLIRANGFVIPWDSAQQNPVAEKEWLKAGGIFPAIIKDRHWMLFGDRNIWLTSSPDGLKWEADIKPFIRPRKNNFDSAHVEMGPPPIKTDKGWLILYHGIDDKITYRLGIVLLDINNPYKILFRSTQPIFEPQMPYELTGTIDLTHDNSPKVIFCCGAGITDGVLRIFYGAGDTYICTATAPLDKLLKLTE